jgi:hypothetical protein
VVSADHRCVVSGESYEPKVFPGRLSIAKIDGFPIRGKKQARRNLLNESCAVKAEIAVLQVNRYNERTDTPLIDDVLAEIAPPFWLVRTWRIAFEMSMASRRWLENRLDL